MKKIVFKFMPMLLLTLGLALSSCEDVIDVDLDQGAPKLVVDGFVRYFPFDTGQLNQQPDTVKLSTTAPYFENQPTPGVNNAKVWIIEMQGGQTLMTDTLANLHNQLPKYSGYYITQNLTPKVNHIYRLYVVYQGDTFVAESQLQPGSNIDSLTFQQRVEETAFWDIGYYLEYNGTERQGAGDNYWFRIYRNGKFLNRANQLAFTSDDAITPDDPNQPNRPIVHWQVSGELFDSADVAKLEIYAIDDQTLDFLNEFSEQVNNQGIFANPPFNVRTNVTNISNPNGEAYAVGWFAAVSVAVAQAEAGPHNSRVVN